jgi:hypothetical protein
LRYREARRWCRLGTSAGSYTPHPTRRDSTIRRESAVGRARQPADDIDDTRADIGIEIDEERLLLLHQVSGDARAQLASRAAAARVAAAEFLAHLVVRANNDDDDQARHCR